MPTEIMLSAEASASYRATPAQVWALVGQFGSLAWHPAVASTVLAPDLQRTVTTRDGAVLVEALLAFDDAARSLRYRIIDSPLPVAGYVSTLSVTADNGGARVTWRSEFQRKPGLALSDAEVCAPVVGIYRAGLDGLRVALGEAAG